MMRPRSLPGCSPLDALPPLALAAVFWLASPAAAAAETSPRPHLHLFVAEARFDTLDASLSEVVPAAEHALEADHWKMAMEPNPHRVATEWKEFHHPLARLLLGDVRARCVADIRALGGRRTAVRFQGGLATQTDIESSPAFAVAEAAYRTAVRDFYQDVRSAIAKEREEKASTPHLASDRHSP